MAWQQIQIGRSRDAAAQSEHALSSAVGRLAAERLKTVGREELTSTMRWLDDFYRSSEGLQRPTGLWLSDRLDSEAIAVWIFDVYLQARMSGKSDAEARELVMGQIKSTEEWRRKHPAT